MLIRPFLEQNLNLKKRLKKLLLIEVDEKHIILAKASFPVFERIRVTDNIILSVYDTCNTKLAFHPDMLPIIILSN